MNFRKDIKAAIISGDLEKLKEIRQGSEPVVIAFVDTEGNSPTSYYVTGHGMMTLEEFENYKSLQNGTRTKAGANQ